MTRAPSPVLRLQPLAEVLEGVTSRLPLEVGTPEARVAVRTLDLDMPLEIRIDEGAELRISLPRGRLATGFDLPHGRLVVHFDTVTAVAQGDLR